MKNMSVEQFAREITELMPQVFRGMMRRETHAVAKGQITAPQFFVLYMLCCQGPQKMSLLASEVGVSLPAMTGLVNRLHKMGMVKRIHSKEDRRVITIELTNKGKNIVKSVRDQKMKMAAELYTKLTKKDRQDYLRVLNKMKKIFLAGITMCLFMNQVVFGQGADQKRVDLSLKDVSRIALENNLDIQSAKYDAYIRRTDLSKDTSLFDTVLTASGSYANDQKKTASAFSGTKNILTDYSVGIEKTIPSGAILGVDLQDQRASTNSAFATINPSHDASIKFSITQPLGRNFFGLIDRGNIKVTKIEIENSDHTALDRIEQSLSASQNAYWQLMLRYAQVRIEGEMLDKAQELYDIFKEKSENGLIEDAELFAAEANVVGCKARLQTAETNARLANNALLLLLYEEDSSLMIVPQDVFNAQFQNSSLEAGLSRAIVTRRDYKQAKKSVEAKNISLSMKENNLWPQIDLQASFLHNGLEVSQKNAWDNITAEDNPELYAGILVRFPLENTYAKGEREKAQLEKAKALLGLKQVEHKILIDINDKLNALNNAKEQIGFNDRIVVLQEKKLEFEEMRFASGRSSSDTLIRYQEDLLQAKLGLANARCAYQSALIQWKVAQNILLDEYWEGEL
ncbi:MAG: TolC family protein [PVC group bacterium]|nr:TolC family protein [PVC group bacterium]